MLQDTTARLDARDEVLQIVKSLRKRYSKDRTRQIVELAQLRIRGRRKFEWADQMFFTPAALEMATDQTIAAYKADRFQDFENVVDGCCSIGGDLFSLTKRKQDCGTVGFDLDPVAVLFANANLDVLDHPSAAIVGDFAEIPIREFDAIHIDPDRRQQGRSTFGDKFSPSLVSIFEKLDRRISAAIKVAPATGPKDFYPAGIERQWIGHSRECKQQIIWTEDLANRKNNHVATIIDGDEVSEFAKPIEHIESCQCKIASQMGEFVFEPHNTVLAAKLTDSLAFDLNLCRIENDIAYLTGNQMLTSPLMQSFQVLDCVSGDVKKISASIKRHQLGKLEIKNRGVEDNFVNQVRKIHASDGNRAGTVILTRFQGNHCAIVATRPEENSGSAPREF